MHMEGLTINSIEDMLRKRSLSKMHWSAIQWVLPQNEWMMAIVNHNLT